MDKLIEKECVNIENMIYEIRGKQVMLDSDLAKLYQCKNGTKDVNKAVNRNIERFPKDFYFQLTKEEYDNLKFHFGTSRFNSHGGVRKLPYVFTEQGVAMLASVLKSKIAAEVSIQIMDAFVLMRKYISNSLIEQQYINKMVIEHDKELKILHSTLECLEKKNPTNEIYFDGQIYDAYSKLIDIMNKAEEELVIIDAYADKSVLDMIRKINVPVLLITKNNNLLRKIDLKKYNSQYHNLRIVYTNTFHDRYLILDKRNVYHCGASLNYAGSKTFSINKIEDDIVITTLIKKVEEEVGD